MKRYYLSPMVQAPGPGGTTTWMPRLLQLFYGQPDVAISAIVPPDPAAPGATALCVMSAVNHGAAIADPTLDVLPDLSPDAVLSSLTPARRSSLLSRMQALGIDTGSLSTSTAYREVIRRIGQHNQAGFDENDFDAAL